MASDGAVGVESPAKRGETLQRDSDLMVEMGGIEPPSTAVILRLLRVQLVRAFYSALTFATSIQVNRPSLSKSPAQP